MGNYYSRAHKFCVNNRSGLEHDYVCGCFNCLRVFDPREIQDWVDGGTTAMCPECGLDTIIGAGTGYPITRDFLKEMRDLFLAGGV